MTQGLEEGRADQGGDDQGYSVILIDHSHEQVLQGKRREA
jgi:hypothetical protein